MPIDPVTAAFNAVAALFNFLSTPAGQKAVDNWNDLFKQLLTEAHTAIAAGQTPPTPKPGPTNP